MQRVGIGDTLFPMASSRTAADAFDVNRLMERVRQDVSRLMQEQLQQAVFLCASLCAEHVASICREMHPRCVEREGGPSDFAQSTSLSLAMNSVSVPEFGSLQFPDAREVAPALRYRAAPPSYEDERGLDLVALHDSYDSAFIETHDAVQTLEGWTDMATKTMTLIEEALGSFPAASNDVRSEDAIYAPFARRSPGAPAPYRPVARASEDSRISVSRVNRADCGAESGKDPANVFVESLCEGAPAAVVPLGKVIDKPQRAHRAPSIASRASTLDSIGTAELAGC